jgi:hypothetical protein
VSQAAIIRITDLCPQRQITVNATARNTGIVTTKKRRGGLDVPLKESFVLSLLVDPERKIR